MTIHKYIIVILLDYGYRCEQSYYRDSMNGQSIRILPTMQSLSHTFLVISTEFKTISYNNCAHCFAIIYTDCSCVHCLIAVRIAEMEDLRLNRIQCRYALH